MSDKPKTPRLIASYKVTKHITPYKYKDFIKEVRRKQARAFWKDLGDIVFGIRYDIDPPDAKVVID